MPFSSSLEYVSKSFVTSSRSVCLVHDNDNPFFSIETIVLLLKVEFWVRTKWRMSTTANRDVILHSRFDITDKTGGNSGSIGVLHETYVASVSLLMLGSK